MKLLMHTHELNIAKEQDKWLLEREKNEAVIKEGYTRKYGVLQKAMYALSFPAIQK